MRGFLSAYAEDVALASGVIFAAAGVCMAFGVAYMLILVGVALVAYGVWITRRS